MFQYRVWDWQGDQELSTNSKPMKAISIYVSIISWDQVRMGRYMKTNCYKHRIIRWRQENLNTVLEICTVSAIESDSAWFVEHEKYLTYLTYVNTHPRYR